MYFLQDRAPVNSGHFILKRVFVRSLLLLSLLFSFFPLFAYEQIYVGAGANTAEIVYSTTSETVLQFQVGSYQKTQVEIDGDKWYQISLSKEGKLLDEGFPELPVMNRSIIIDDQALMKAEVFDIEYEDIHLAVAPSKGDLTRDIDPDTIPFRFDAMYKNDEFFPGEIASLSQPYIMREFRGIVVQTRPFAYNPVSQTLRIFTSYKVRVYAQGLDTVNVLTTSRSELSREFVSIYENHYLNWENYRYTPVSDSFGKLLIIYDDSYYDAILPYCNWKRQKGITTYLVPISNVGTTATQLEDFIQSYYTIYGITYVQLVGDSQHIPTKTVQGGGADPVFALVAGTDSYPDIFVSRFSAESSAELTTQVNKVITYERDLGTTHTWLQRAIGVASDEGPGDDGEYDWEHMDYIRDDLLGYGYTLVDQIDPNHDNDTAAYLSQRLNNGRGLMNYCGHGETDKYTTTSFGVNHAAALSNGVMTPVIFNVACWVGSFVNRYCLAEAFLRKSGGGAVAFYGSSVAQTWNPPMAAQDEFVDLLVADSKKTVGGLFYNGACKMLDDYPDATNMYKTWNIFGDASMLMRTKTPAPMSVTYTKYIIVGVQTTINVSTGVPFAFVGISFNDGIYTSGYANILGNFTTFIQPSSCSEYTLTVTAHNRVTYVGTIYAGFIWKGRNTTDWNNGSNWNTGILPNANDDVLIPNGCPRYPATSAASGNCKNLRIESSSSITISTYNLNVYGNMHTWGHLVMTAATDLNVLGNISWESGATATISNASAEIYCWGDMNFQDGSNVQFAMGYVEFRSTSRNSYLTNQSANTQLFNLRTNVSHPYAFIINSYSSHDIVIKGSVWNYEGKNSSCLYEGNVSIKGNVTDFNTTANGMQWSQGMVILDGTNQQLGLVGAASYLKNLHIYASGTVSLTGNLTLKGNLSFQTGYLNPGANTITIGGHWSNNVGPSAFIEGNSTVVFNASGHQYCNRSEDFNKLVLNKSSGALRVNGSSAIVTCASYEWISGSIDLLAGTFTAYSLVNNSIAGGWYLNEGCTINLHNTGAGAWIDLTGRLHIFGGTFNVYGGSTPCYWPYSSTASIEMSGGILDFKDQGVYLSAGLPDFTNEISGGTIRVNGGFYGSRTDFNPTGGTIEMVGSVDCTLSHGVGSNFHNVVINKSRIRDDDGMPIWETDKDGNTREVTRANMVNAASNLVIKGNFTISAGLFLAPELMKVAGSWSNTVGVYGFNAREGTVTFNQDGWTQSVSGANYFYNVTDIHTGASLSFYGVTSVANTLSVNNIVYFYGKATLHSVFNYDSNAKLEFFNEHTHNIANYTGGGFLHVGSGSSVNIADLVQNGLYGSYKVTAGHLTIHQDENSWIDLNGNMTILSNGVVDIYGGNSDLFFGYNGNCIFSMNSGAFNVRDWGIYNSGSYTYTSEFNISGGTIRSNGGWHDYRGNFKPSGGAIEFTGSVDATVSAHNSSWFYNMVVNKTASRQANEPEFVTDREGNTMPLTRACNLTLGEVIIRGYMHITAVNEVSLAGHVSCTNQGDISVNAGILNLWGNILATSGNISVYGELRLTQGSSLHVSGGKILTVYSGGWLRCLGSQTTQAMITNIWGYYGINIESGGLITAAFTTFEYLNNNGVYVKPGGMVDTDYAFYNCTFQNGVSYGRLLTIDNNQNLTITGAVFPANSWSGRYNVAKTVDAGSIYFANWSGNFGGADEELDDYNRIFWQGSGDQPRPQLSISKVPNSSNLRLDWTYPFAASSYKIYRRTDPNGTFAYWTSTTNKYYIITPTSTHYFYKVTAEVP